MKPFSAIILSIALTSTCFAQGFVTFQNGVAFQTIDPTGGAHLVWDVGSPFDPTIGRALSGSQYVAELYLGADANSLMPLTASISRFRNATVGVQGKWATSTIYGTANDPTQLPGLAPGSIATLAVRVWDYSQFPTYEEALGHTPTGSSAPFTYAVPLCPNDPTCYYMENLQAFALVPEPKVLAVAFVAVGALLIREQKKASPSKATSRRRMNIMP